MITIQSIEYLDSVWITTNGTEELFTGLKITIPGKVMYINAPYKVYIKSGVVTIINKCDSIKFALTDSPYTLAEFKDIVEGENCCDALQAQIDSLQITVNSNGTRLNALDTQLYDINLILSDLYQYILGKWETSNRPVASFIGQSGFNLDLNQREYWDGTTWIQY